MDDETITQKTSTTLEIARVTPLHKDTKDFLVKDTTNLRLLERKRQDAFTVETREWDKIKERLDKIEISSPIYQNLSYTFLGILFSSIIFLVTISPTETRTWLFILAWVLVCVSAVFTLAFGVIASREKKRTTISIQTIKEDMEFFEGRFFFRGDDED